MLSMGWNRFDVTPLKISKLGCKCLGEPRKRWPANNNQKLTVSEGQRHVFVAVFSLKLVSVLACVI